MAELTAPHDLDAERAVVGAVLARPDLVAEVAAVVDHGDFYKPANGHVFAAVLDLHDRGERWDGRAVLNTCAARGAPVEAVDIVEAQAAYTGAWRAHAGRVADLRARRELLGTLTDAAGQATDPAVDVGDLVAGVLRRLDSIDRPASRVPTSLSTLDVVADRSVDTSPWVVPGLLRQGWRAVVVGLEGSGKSVLARQFAVCTAAGIHPLHYKPIPPLATLLVDLENPADVVTSGAKQLRDQSGRLGMKSWVWEEPGGIDLASRRHRAELDAICAATNPSLVCLGPMYKAFHAGGKVTEEQAVREVQSVLDDLRTRHGFALLLEHHAPHDASNGTSAGRRLRPYGSSLWLRWPEFGLGLQPDEKHPRKVMHLKRWRGDRTAASWPDRIEHGTTWPWVGVWNETQDELVAS